MYEFFRFIALLTGWPIQLALFKTKKIYEDENEKNRRVKGAALVISNHFSVFDYMVNLFLFGWRKLYIVMSESGFKDRALRKFGLKCFGGINAKRDVHGMRFIDQSVSVLKKGKMVQIFPEAYITHDGRMHEFKPSYIMIALRSGAPIIPVITDGNYGVFKQVHIIIGKKIYLSDYCDSVDPTREEIEKLNEMVYNKAKELRILLEQRTNGTDGKDKVE